MRLSTVSILVALLAVPHGAQGQKAPETAIYNEETCGSLANNYGPIDYRIASRDQKVLVEGAHFTKDVENLKAVNDYRGVLRIPGGDIDYTLRAFPNHPRALFALMRLEAKEKKLKPSGARWPVPCYFERAIRFTPDDGSVRLVFGMYLLKHNDAQGAVREMEFAQKQLGDDANVAYNLGLAYFQAGKYEQAVTQAKRARELGMPLDGLEKMLKRAGKWTD